MLTSVLVLNVLPWQRGVHRGFCSVLLECLGRGLALAGSHRRSEDPGGVISSGSDPGTGDVVEPAVSCATREDGGCVYFFLGRGEDEGQMGTSPASLTKL